MVSILADNIVSPLGFTTEQNYSSVRAGESALKLYSGKWNLPEPFVASLFTEEQNRQLHIDGLTRFESIAFVSASRAISSADIDVSSPKSIFILSTTKANVELLGSADCDSERIMPASSARLIANKLGFTTEPIVVCNACISGLAAQSLAFRLLSAGEYDNAVVCGADCQSAFIVSGFQSLKAVSPEQCRPFDIERMGLNLGEAAATIVLSTEKTGKWSIEDACVRNDAHHISAPSPKGEGAFRAMNYVLGDAGNVAVVGVHGTATMFNDQMESKAVERMDLSDIPLSALKGYYGHTMGAAGVLETILTLRALDDGIVLPSRGFSELGVSGKVSISAEEQKANDGGMLKILSGFGGCNAAMLVRKTDECKPRTAAEKTIRKRCSVQISEDGVVVDGSALKTEAKGKELLTELYKNHISDYPKFYKMDALSKLAFVASELLLASANADEDEGRAVILFNRSSSVVSDKAYQQSISNADEFFPSPSVFVYTLPNIMTGEIAIRHGYRGETSLYILAEKNEEQMRRIVQSSFADAEMRTAIVGWVDCENDDCFCADMGLYVASV
ncbi:MAG: 3-oxoacyl-ACP synthase [Bacteroidaceae bacterium]|nr:3-oxoacyl-ACP synthase [Bacteroidaceae bacterium]MBQ7482821.1 3-oxoacyl-ACP synthase [Bacteroidaceae bacterium]